MQTLDRNSWLKGGTAHCNTPPLVPKQVYRLVLLGAPGVGKGTQAELLSKRLGTCHLSTGDIFRAAKSCADCEPTPAMKSALDCMRKGELVTDETVLALVAERAACLQCGCGFLLDGFPRTLAQAEALAKVLRARKVKLDAVINYELPLASIVARLSGRRTCLKCKSVFHIDSRPPKTASICDHCGSVLEQREDDLPKSIHVRMQAYEKCTVPLAEFYGRQGLLITIPAEGTPEQICQRALQHLSTAALAK
jgi:adenylate kinase